MLDKLCGLITLCAPYTYDQQDIIEHMHAASEHNLAEYINVPQELATLVEQTIITAQQAARAQETARTLHVFCQLHENPYVVLYALNGRDFVGQLRFRLGNGSYYISLLETSRKSRLHGIANMLLLDAYALAQHHARTHGYSSVMIHWAAIAMDEGYGLTQEQLIKFYEARGAHIEIAPTHMRVQFAVK